MKSKGEPITNQDLTGILDRVLQLTNSCDLKASIVLGLIGTLATVFLTTDYISKCISIISDMIIGSSRYGKLLILVLVLSIITIIFGFICLLSVVVTRTSPRLFLKRGALGESVIYFSMIAQIRSLHDYVGKIDNITPDLLRKDILSEIYVCSIICNIKHKRYKIGLYTTLAGFVSFYSLLITSYVFF